jgi:Na+/melibiose symporter-like transporter
MSNERNGYRAALVLFAIALIIAVLVAFVTTFERVDTKASVSETAAGTTGLAKAHVPLDRAPGQPVLRK